MLRKAIDASHLSDDNKDLYLKLLELVDKKSLEFYNQCKHIHSSNKIKDKYLSNQVDVLYNIVNNKRLNYLKEIENLNKKQEDEYVKLLKELRNKLYLFNNNINKSLEKKRYSMSGFDI